MKLKKCLIAGFLIAGAVAHLSFTTTYGNDDEINLSNIEALSRGETKNYCNGIGSVDCPVSNIKVYLVIYAK